ncbi:MAG: NAD(P)H-dependent oxidoreductase [Flavobacteriales bacterium]|nr:NAD(P)H-dependent oxidoreductase [Flavobacteriales bacterium]
MKFYTGFGENQVNKMEIKSDDKFVVITGTNRPNSMSELVAKAYGFQLEENGVTPTHIHLKDLPRDFVFADAWEEKSPLMNNLINTMEEATKYIFVIPEYNGGFPGVLKAFIDCIPPTVLHGKKAGLIGVSSGMAGAARGMDQFTNVLNYLQVNVLYKKPKFSQIDKAVQDGAINNERMSNLMTEHAQRMVSF